MEDDNVVASTLLGSLACLLLAKKQLQIEGKARTRRRRRYWVHPILLRRKSQGDYENLLQEMRLYDKVLFFNYTRMSIMSFEKLLRHVAPYLQKKSHREFISPECRLAVTLRFLATGDSYPSLAYAFRLGVSTVCVIIKETCSAIWATMSPVYLKCPNTAQYKEIAYQFYNQWQLPNCVGSIDGKHVVIQAPANSGSTFYNYKKSFSIVLLAVCDANYNFTCVDIGAYGSQSDGGILNESPFGKKLLNNELSLPENSPFPGDDFLMPYYFVGDEAFPLRTNLMRPISKVRTGSMEESERIFNYRLSRARRIIENTFGILVARFRIFHRVINAAPDTVDCIIKACVCLHNFIRAENNKQYFNSAYVDGDIQGKTVPGGWRNDAPKKNALEPLSSIGRRLGSRNHSTLAASYRNYIKDYVNGIGGNIAPWQWEYVRKTN